MEIREGLTSHRFEKVGDNLVVRVFRDGVELKRAGYVTNSAQAHRLEEWLRENFK